MSKMSLTVLEQEKSKKMMITHKFRLYPNKQQESKMLETLDLCRQTYNTLLGELNEQKIIDRSQIQGTIPDIKICEPKLRDVYSKTLQYECYRLFSNLRALAKSKGKQKSWKIKIQRKRLVQNVYLQPVRIQANKNREKMPHSSLIQNW